MLRMVLMVPTTPMGTFPNLDRAIWMEVSISLAVMGISTTGVSTLRAFRLAAVPPRDTITSAS